MLTHRILSRLRLAAPLVALSLFSPLTSFGQAIPRIQGIVDPASTVALKGTKPAYTRGPSDLGRVADSASGRMVLLLNRSPEQQSALDQYLAAQKDPKSADYHKWLTPEQFGARFGVSDADLQSVTSYLSSQGFAVSRTYKSKMGVEFSGTAAQVRASFGTEIHAYQGNGRTFTANANEVQIPRALAPVVRGIAGLSNYSQPQAHGTVALVRDPKTGKSHPLYADANNGIESVSPGDLAVIYDIPTTKYDGTGVTVGIISDSNVNVAIPAAYRTTFGLPANDPAVVVDGVDPGITADADLTYGEIELVAATAPAAKVNVYTAADTDLSSGIDLATVRAIEDNTINVLVFGFESCEANFTPLRQLFYQSFWEQAAAQGISVIVTSGSGGAAGCDAGTNGNGVAAASHGLAVNGYASSVYNTAVGTTDFFYGPTGTVSLTDLSGFLKYWSEDNTTYTSAKGYIPEQPFNASNQATNQETFTPRVIASGGGVSSFSSTASVGAAVAHSSTARPSYQSAVVPELSAGGRTVPDVSIFGAFPANGSTYILCILATDCVNGSPEGGLTYNGVLSPNVSVGAFGGIAALIVQAKGVQGNLNPNLYAASLVPGTFNDITNGTNQVQCVSGSPDCVNGLTAGYVAKAGYDEASGLGSADVANLINAWPAAKPAASLTVSLTKNGQPVSSFKHGDTSVTLNISVAGSSSTPSGDVGITLTNAQPASSSPAFYTLANGTASDNQIAYVLPGGSYNLVARYAGDGVYGATTAVLPVTVGQVTSKLTLLSTDQAGNPLTSYTGQTLPYGSHVSMTFEVGDLTDGQDPQAATGYVQLYDNGQQVARLHLDSLGFASYISTNLTPGSHVFTATFPGDPTFTSATLSGAGPSLVIAGVPTTTTLASTDPNIVARNSATYLVATVTPNPGTATAGGSAPAGTVNFYAGTVLLGSARLDRGNNTGANPSATAAFLLRPNTFAFGTVSPVVLTAAYVPDASGEYQASTSNVVDFTVGFTRGLANSTTRLAATPAGATTFLDTSTLTVTATVATSGGTASTPAPTGTVTFFSNGQPIQQSDANGNPVPNPVQLVNGVATFTMNPNFNASSVLPLPQGQSFIIAQYSGDSAHTPSTTSYTVNVYDELSTPDFQLRADQVYGIISPSRTTTQFHLDVDAVKNFDTLKQRVALTFTTPPNITCTTTNPNPLPNPVSLLTVVCGPSAGVTVAAVQPVPAAPGGRGLRLASEGGAVLACLLLFGVPARRRAWQSMLGAIVLIAATFGMSGCGTTMANGGAANFTNATGAASPVGGGTTLAKGSYTVIVTGTATVLNPTVPNTTLTVVHTLPLKVVVQ